MQFAICDLRSNSIATEHRSCIAQSELRNRYASQIAIANSNGFVSHAAKCADGTFPHFPPEIADFAALASFRARHSACIVSRNSRLVGRSPAIAELSGILGNRTRPLSFPDAALFVTTNAQRPLARCESLDKSQEKFLRLANFPIRRCVSCTPTAQAPSYVRRMQLLIDPSFDEDCAVSSPGFRSFLARPAWRRRVSAAKVARDSHHVVRRKSNFGGGGNSWRTSFAGRRRP